MAPASSIGTQDAARNVIIDAKIIKIDNVKFSSAIARQWKHSIIAAAKNVRTKLAGAAGLHCHTYLVKSDANFHKRPVVNPFTAINPGAIKHTTNVAEVN